MREEQVEQHLLRRCKRQGWKCEKFTSPGRRSVPDRLLTLPDNRIVFVEVKRPGQEPTELQARDHAARRGYACEVYVVRDKDEVDALVDWLC